MEQFKEDIPMLDTGAETAAMLERIDSLRLYALKEESGDYLNDLSERIYYFDQDLQATLKERFGDENLRKMVPVWHKLVGSTVEDHEANPEAKAYVAEAVERFVSEMEEKWQLN